MTNEEEQALIEAHLPLVRHVVFQVATRYPRHVDREELATAGTLGLVEAARRWDPERGVPFDRFATQRIRGAILDSVRSSDWAPRSVRAAARAIADANQQLGQALGRPPTDTETADAMEVTPEALGRLQARIVRSVLLTLDRQVGVDGESHVLGDTLVDRAPLPDDAVVQSDLLERLRSAVAALPPRHARVVAGYFLEERTSAELAIELGVTESRVSQLRSDAVARLRGELLREELGDQPRNASNDGNESRPPAVSTAS